MTDTVRVPRDPDYRMMDAGIAALHKASRPINELPGYIALRAAYAAMLAASPQGEGDCVCVQRGYGPEGCGLCNETGVVTEGVKPQPDALPGGLREKVARLILDFPFNINCEREVPALADAILSLIQSERGGA